MVMTSRGMFLPDGGTKGRLDVCLGAQGRLGRKRELCIVGDRDRRVDQEQMEA